MNRKSSNIIIAICLGAILVLISGCGKKPAGPENDNAPFEIKIDQMHDLYLGHFTDVVIKFEGDFSKITTLDLRIAFDQDYLVFSKAEPGGLLINNEWEYFTYSLKTGISYGDNSDPSMVHFYATKSNHNNPTPLQGQANDSASIIILTFLTKNNHDNDCSFTPIRFYWGDCYDNLLFTDFPDSAICAAAVYDTGQVIWSRNVDESGGGITPSVCAEDSQLVFSPVMNFTNGGFGIICDSLIDDRCGWGNINTNEHPYEIADAVMFTNYFISGLSAFGDHIECSIQASDANGNGIPLEVADLDYLVRVIQGDALPYLPQIYQIPVNITHHINGEYNSIYYNSPHDMGAMLLEFEVTGDVLQPALLDNATDMDIIYNVDSGFFRVLIYNIGPEKIENGQGGILSFESSGDVSLNYIEISHYNGINVPVEIIDDPVIFELAQNYPNPFSTSTAIQIALAFESDWSIEIFDVIGEPVKTFEGYSTAGTIEITWDGKDDNGDDVSSGVYFYRATVGDRTITKKMMLLR